MHLIEFLIILLDIPVIGLIFGSFLPARNKADMRLAALIRILPVLLFAAARMIMGQTVEQGHIYMAVNMLSYSLMVFLIGDMIFAGRWQIKLLLALLSIVFALFSEFAVYLAVGYVTRINYFEADGMMHYAGVIAAKFLEFSIIYLLNRGHRQRETGRGEWHLYALQTVIPLLSAVFFLLYPVFSPVDGEWNGIRYFLAVLIFMLINTVHYAVFALHRRTANENHEKSMMLQEYKYKEEYYQSVERYQKEIRSLKHDMKNQLITLQAYLGNDGDGKAAVEAGQILAELVEKDDLNYTAHPGLNALLNAKRSRAGACGITCEFSLSVSPDMGFAFKDIGALLGNLLDNAVEACEACSGIRYISLQMVYFNHSLVIRIANSAKEAVTDFGSNKADPSSHGFGLPNIKRIVERYHGDITVTTGENTFCTDIVLWENIPA